MWKKNIANIDEKKKLINENKMRQSAIRPELAN